MLHGYRTPLVGKFSLDMESAPGAGVTPSFGVSFVWRTEHPIHLEYDHSAGDISAERRAKVKA